MKGTYASFASFLSKAAAGRFKTLTEDRLIYTAGCCIYGFAVSGAPSFLGATPFGVALMAAWDVPLPLGALSLCLGGAVRGRLELIPVYLVMLFFRLTARLLMGAESKRLNGVLCAVGMCCLTLLRLSTAAEPSVLLSSAVGTATALGIYLCLKEAEEGNAGRRAALLALIYGGGCALRGLSFYGISVATAVGFIVTMNMSTYGGATFGCASGALWGMGCDPVYAPAFAVSALIGGRTSSPLLSVGAGALFCMLFATFTTGYRGIRDFLPDIAVAAAAMPALTRLRFMKWDQFFLTDSETDEDEDGKDKEKRLAAVAGALGALSAIFYGMSDRLKTREDYRKDKDMTGAFADDYAAMSELITSALREEESPPDKISAGKVWGMLRMSRMHPTAVRATSGRIKRLHIEGLPKSVLNDPESLRTRLSNLCGVSFAPPSFRVDDKGVLADLSALPLFTAEWSSCTRAKEVESVNGDSLTAFTTDNGRFFCVLCDGMGSGRDAAIASRTCCVFLQKMLEGGADPALSVRMLNTFLRGKGYECFATVDIFSLDLYTGEAYFIKGGSAPSHLFRAGCEYTMASATAPVGIIREVYAERIAFSVMDGDWVIMRSDGAETDTPPAPPKAATPSTAAKELLASALSQGSRDDTTVCAIKIRKR